ncbi:peptidase [Bifidobacterium italicum]|uniref:Peptidase n=1 Tax=Bifidobacterium italicum TaxID=1960968 RepID=A0A2A2EJQ5_9BIFI|nr:dipeptidase [Bifidobacterium italicum]PAU69464.1 peptidase [Bifidobacterium italicum]
MEISAQEIRARVAADWQGIMDVVRQKVALRSVSAQGITGDHMEQSAQYVARIMREVGVDARVVQSHNPDGTAGAWEVIGSLETNPDAPTVLLYAHHDVQPVPDPNEWDTDPFEVTQVGDRLYGRGTCDDTGGIAIHYGALKALGDDLGVNIKIFFEGEEEMGSASFIPFIEEHHDEFDSDVIIVADSGNWAPDVPSLTTSLRGNATCDVHVKVLEHPVHSGQYGGPILDANTLAAMLIAKMYDEDGALAIPGVEGGDPIGGLQRDVEEMDMRAAAGVVDSYRLAGDGSLASRLWTKPSATVIGFDAHPVDGSFNVISPETTFRVSLRVSPLQDPHAAMNAMVEFFEGNAPFGADVHVTPLDAGMGWAMDPDCEASADAAAALEEAFGVAPVNKGEGGSIPFIPELQKIFPDAQVLVTGPEDPISNAHSPNESVSVSGLEKDVIAEALLLDKLGRN